MNLKQTVSKYITPLLNITQYVDYTSLNTDAQVALNNSNSLTLY